MNWPVGTRILAINPLPASRAEKGSVYTVAGWSKICGLNPDGTQTFGVLLKELPPIRFLQGEPLGFDHRRFRPVVDRKTDISALKALLNTARAKVPA